MNNKFFKKSHPLPYRDAVGVMLFLIFFFNLVFFILAFEGLLCITMGFPIVVFIGWTGASIAYALHENNKRVSMNVLTGPLLLIPVFATVEMNDDQTPPEVSIKTEVIISASKQVVWNELVSFSTIDEPTEFIFKSGLAYPVYAG